jgi:hypothetical protein
LLNFHKIIELGDTNKITEYRSVAEQKGGHNNIINTSLKNIYSCYFFSAGSELGFESEPDLDPIRLQASSRSALESCGSRTLLYRCRKSLRSMRISVLLLQHKEQILLETHQLLAKGRSFDPKTKCNIILFNVFTDDTYDCMVETTDIVKFADDTKLRKMIESAR